tara:strand:- start:627 stop:833 length:207 start_codon:yes stop_codon:yes gene_type:complete
VNATTSQVIAYVGKLSKCGPPAGLQESMLCKIRLARQEVFASVVSKKLNRKKQKTKPRSLAGKLIDSV